jgi:hypothetical protein
MRHPADAADQRCIWAPGNYKVGYGPCEGTDPPVSRVSVRAAAQSARTTPQPHGPES